MEFGEGAILTQRHRDLEISTENTKGSSSLCLSLFLCVEDQSSHSTLKLRTQKLNMLWARKTLLKRRKP